MLAFHRRPCWLAALAVLFLAFPSTSLLAVEYFVSPTGNDANTGRTLATAWRTIQRSLRTTTNAVTAGDVITVKAGTYNELIIAGKAGTVTAPITLRAAPGEAVNITGVGATFAPNQVRALFRTNGFSNITLDGLVLSNLISNQPSTVPTGIWIGGGAQNIRLLNLKIREIGNNSPTTPLNAHGILVDGASATPISGLVIQGCEIYNLSLGSSEAVAINGNVDGFVIRDNSVHNVDNIGIDLIGYEGRAPVGSIDRARNGLVVGNTVYNIDSGFNIAYSPNPVTGLRFRAAAGIYADGATQCIIERNHVYNCNYGIEVASERQSTGLCDFITVRNNLMRHNHSAGLIIGGYAADRGTTADCDFHNNTIYQNCALEESQFDGQVIIQHNCLRNKFHHNFVGNSPLHNFGQMIFLTGQNIAGNSLDWNAYHNRNSTLEFVIYDSLGGFTSYSLAAWRAWGGWEQNSKLFTTPGFVGGFPTAATATPASFKLLLSSLLRDAGNPAYAPPSTEADYFGLGRLQGPRVDFGMAEFHEPWVAYLESFFGFPLPPGSAYTENGDPDGDKQPNLLEYAQGTNPAVANPSPVPPAVVINSGSLRKLRLYYAKQPGATDVTFVLETNTHPASPWAVASTLEFSEGPYFYREIPAGAARRFARLKLTRIP